jgi:hypothetical protein
MSGAHPDSLEVADIPSYGASPIKRNRRTKAAVEQLERQILEVLREEHLPDEIDLHFHRLAITEAQIDLFNLPTKPRKESDRRALHVKETVEAEAMPAGILRHLLRSKIESFLPAGALEVAKVAEESERAHLERRANLMAEARP